MLSDQAPYMMKAGKLLKELFPNLKHISCIIHGSNRVCEFIKDKFDVNKLIAAMKAVLVKSNHRRQLFRLICKLQLPPDVIEIRWNSWLNTAFYYANNIIAIRPFVTALNSKKSKAVTKLKTAIAKHGLDTSLYLVNKYKFLTEAITRLEAHGLIVPDQIAILKSVKDKLRGDDLAKLERVMGHSYSTNEANL